MDDENEEIRIATEDGGGGEFGALFVHATGFCKELWRPVVDRISTGLLSWVSMDLRGHGESDKGPLPTDWDFLARDVIGVLGDTEAVVGIGHSCGGGVIARAEAFRPGLFSRLVLIEPIIFPPPFRRTDNPLSAVARRRRRVFASRDAAYERFASGPFGSWDPDALACYIDHGFRTAESGWELKCSPEVESDFYAEGLNHNTWDLLEKIDVPVTLVAGERSDTHPKSYLDVLASRFRDAEVIIVPGVGHLVPMEDPSSIARIVERAVAAT